MSTSTATHHLDDMLLFDNILVTASLQDPSIFAPSSSMRTPPSGSNNNDVSGTWECDDFEDVTEQETRVSRIGISESPQYNIGADYYEVLNDVRDNDEEQDNEAATEEEEAADHKSFDSRIGISPSVYQQPDVPESPQQLFLKQQTTTVASTTEMPDFMYDRPQHVYFGDSDGNVSALYSSHSEAEDHVVHQMLPPITRSKRKKQLHQEQDDGIRRLFHPQTKRGHFLIHANVAMPTKRIKYNLTSKTAQLLNGGGGGDIMDDSISTTSTHSIMSESVASCSSPHKIFILLLNPEAKLFELIQVIYNPHDASIFNIMEWIPANSTEPLLGHAPYTGLVRPKERHIPLDRGMASHGDHNQDHHCSILCGEILVAIPQYYTSEEIVRYAKPILKDKQVLDLLKRKNPLAPPSSSRMYKKCHKQSPTKNAPKTSPHKSVKYQRLDNEVDDEDDNELYVEYCETSFVSNQEEEEEEDELVVLKTKKKKKGFLYQLIKPFRWLVRHF